ncbi:MAG: hypothetical protein JXX29_07245 [Deltaproteobacteria bacterium]|nr:hypothetical protein [Deltaproteobacteria bacterium]
MSTFFLQRGIRLPVKKPRNLEIKDVDVPEHSSQQSVADEDGAKQTSPFADKYKEVATHQYVPRQSLAERISDFVAEKGQQVVIRLADEDPHSLTQRAITESLKKGKDKVKAALDQLAEKTGVSKFVFACHKGQDLGELVSLAASIIRVHHSHYPMMTRPCLAKRVLGESPVIDIHVRVKGVLVVDIGELMLLTEPDISAVVTVISQSGAQLVRVRRGATVYEILSAMSLLDGSKKVVMGSPLLGDAIYELHVAMTADTLTLFAESQDDLYQNLPCCNCGKCVKVCPSRLLPGLLSKHIYVENFEDAAHLNVHSCIECGCCAFMCPSRRSLVQFMRLGKQESRKAVGSHE